VYKDNWETFLANSGLKVFFNLEDNFSRDYVSKLIGETEVIRERMDDARNDLSFADARHQEFSFGGISLTLGGFARLASAASLTRRCAGWRRGGRLHIGDQAERHDRHVRGIAFEIA